MSREPIRWTERGVIVGQTLQILGGAAGVYVSIWALSALGGAL